MSANSTLPAPMTPQDCDLQDFSYMPLQVARLRDSDFAASVDPTAGFYAMMLWAAIWHQVPAASAPDDDAILAKLCGLGRDVATFRTLKSGILWGFVKCSDGRLYHRMVAEQANNSWSEKLNYRNRKKLRGEIARKGAGARWGSQRTGFTDALSSEMTDASCTSEAILKGKGRVKGHGEISVPDGTGAAAPPNEAPSPILNPEKVMFDGGVALLFAAGVAERQARTLLGKWRRDHGTEAVIAAIGAAGREGAISPVEFITKALDKRQGLPGAGARGAPQYRRDIAKEMLAGAEGRCDDE